VTLPRLRPARPSFVVVDPPGLAFALVGRLLHALAIENSTQYRVGNPQQAITPPTLRRLVASKVDDPRLIREQSAHSVLAHAQHFCHFRHCSEFFFHVAILTVHAIRAFQSVVLQIEPTKYFCRRDFRGYA
jgi:hypothetical protein